MLIVDWGGKKDKNYFLLINLLKKSNNQTITKYVLFIKLAIVCLIWFSEGKKS